MFRKNKQKNTRPLQDNRCLSLEPLEERCVLSTSPFNIDDFGTLPSLVDVGAGSLTTVLPAGESGPNVAPNFTADFDGPVAAAEWWSSVAYPSAGSSFAIYPHPLAALDESDGLAIGYPNEVTGDENGYRYGFDKDFSIGLAGLTASGASVSDYSDWTVTMRWEAGADRLEATLGHGSPFVHATRVGNQAAEIAFVGSISVWSNTGGVAGVTIGGKHYGLFAPAGSNWAVSGDSLFSTLNGQDFFSVAVLPDNTQATLDFYRARAFAFVTDTTVASTYDPAAATSTATYTATIVQQETGGVNVPETLMSLYRHQWLNSSDPLTSYSYESSRGEMKVLAGNSFTTTLTHNGVLPVLPELGTETSRLWSYIDDLYQQPNLLTTTDTYFTATRMQRLAHLIPLAEQVGHLEARERFLFEVQSELEDWFSADDGGEGQFYYDEDWNALIGYPDSFGSAESLNDHHFHYGYFIQSAAIVAMYDPAWAAETAWGGMVELLIRDVANWEREDNTFQFLRNFDVYAGHSWASGNSNFARGNNQESSSEAMNFANSLILWGSVTGDDAIRDVGVYLSTTHQAAIEQYWLDVDDVVFPTTYEHPAAGIVWSDGVDYATFFSGEPELIQGINYLPLNGGSFYLGHDPAYVQAGVDHVISENGGDPDDWQDLIWSYLAFADPDTAIANFNADPTTDIQPLPNTLHWISSLQSLGHVDPSVTADTANYAVFNDGGSRSYIAYNPTSSAITVTYSDGTVLAVPANTLEVSGANTSSWTPNPGLQPQIPENRFYVRDQQSTSATLSSTVGLAAESDDLPAPAGGTFFNVPQNPLTYTATDITASYDPARQTELQLFIDAGTNIANMTQARISYDFDGDGTFDRFEVIGGYATDAAPGWESYDLDQGVVSTSGSFSDLAGGSVRLEVWSVFGPGGVELRTDASFGEGLQSFLEIPYTTVTQTDFLSVSINPSAISENGGVATVTVNLDAPATAITNVSLSSDDPGEATVLTPTTVAIPVGQDSAVFSIQAVADAIADGDQSVTLTATAAGFAPGTGLIQVTDEDVAVATRANLYLLDGAVSSGATGDLSLVEGPAATSDIVPVGSGSGSTPIFPLVYESSGLFGTFNSTEITEFELYLDAGNEVGQATRARVSYDFDGDSNFDRVETYNFFATDPIVAWENYQHTVTTSNVVGSFSDLVDGTVRLELWKVFGGADVIVRTGASSVDGQQSVVSIPFTLTSATPGDYSGDLHVDAADFTVWRDSLGTSVTPFTGADGNGDGIVTDDDRLIWQANFGTTYATPPATSLATQVSAFGSFGSFGSLSFLGESLPMDTDGDALVSLADAAVVIEQLGKVDTQSNAAHDVNGDGVRSPLDALLILNSLNDRGDRLETPLAATTGSASAGNVLFLRGGLGTGGFLEGGGDDQLADINDFATNGGNHGWGELADTLEAAGFTLEQMEEGSGSNGEGSRIPLSTLDLSPYDVIVFGSNNAVYTTADVDALEQFVTSGRGALFISDANFGSDWADASNSDQQFLDRIGIEVHQDRGTYRVGDQAGEIFVPSHPLFEGVSTFDGEGVTPFHIVESVPGVEITLLAGAEGNTRLNQPPFGNRNQGPSRSTNDGDASVFTADWGFGRVVGHFDRNTFFNLNGAGTNINRFDNQQYAVNLFTYLAGSQIPGDYDGNCTVDMADYGAWVIAFGSTSDLASDGDGNGIVDAADYTIWRDHLGSQCE